MKIMLNLSNFTYNHNMMVIDDNGNVVSNSTIEMDTVENELASAIKEYGVSKVTIKGASEFVNKIIDKTTGICVSNYGKSVVPEFEIM